ncbi:hypothetical protein RvY_07538 [Ramazzottius varieornatus]|uniref:Uncharacterized protein n=1 Tax=Ramazzottius varieornatus TaxID=947166 RepID=A0A1D1V5M7_RAMVA|nr:hypothetical protein RvY_07538 [Ramazzottius varieornatus]
MSITSGMVAMLFVAVEFISIAKAAEPIITYPLRGCYYPNWAQYRPGVASFKPGNVDPSLCTYVLVAFGQISGNQLTTLEWNDEAAFQQLNALKASNPNLKILYSVGGWTLTSQLVSMAATPSSRATFVQSAVTQLRKYNLDGLDVDWEFPSASDAPQYSALLTELRAAFDAEGRQTGKQRLMLTAALHLLSDGGYSGSVLNKTLDIANVMTYDMYGAWSPNQVGHQAPLFKGPFGTPSALNTAQIMLDWAAAGVDKSKLAVGLPLYGRGWMSSSSQHGLGSPATGPITASTYTTESGSWPYFEICSKIASEKATKVFDTNIQAAYAYTNTWWMGYDDQQTIIAKTQWAKQNGFGGVYVWDLSTDDFMNMCGQGKNPLLTAIRDTLAGTSTQTTTQLPSSSTARTATMTTTARPISTTRTSPTTTTTRSTARPVPTTTTTKSGSSTVSGVSSVCGRDLCQKNGPGSFAVQACSPAYCDCDANGNAFYRQCGNSLVFDPVKKYCNWKSSVTGCKI